MARAPHELNHCYRGATIGIIEFVSVAETFPFEIMKNIANLLCLIVLTLYEVQVRNISLQFQWLSGRFDCPA